MEIEDTARTLQKAGLSKYQANAYITVLQLGTASATEVAEASSVPKSRIYDVLPELEKKGYVETFEQDSLRVRARDPTAVLSDLRGQADDLESTADAIEDLWEAPSVGDHQITLVKREETVVEKALEGIRDAEGEVQLSVTPEQYDELKPVLHEARSRGVVIKISLHVPKSDQSIPKLDFEGAATEVRYRELSAPFVALVDRVETYFASHNPGNQLGILVENYTLTYVFHWYFQASLWEIWETIYSAAEDGSSRRYVNVRECVRDLDQLLRTGSSVHADIVGYDTTTNEHEELSGEIVDISKSNVSFDTDIPPLTEVAGKAAIHLDTGERIVTIGDWGAIEEDIEGRDIRLRIIEPES